MAEKHLTDPPGGGPDKHDLRLVFWELTARCNLHCQHCRAEAQEGFAAGELTTPEIIRVAHDIRASFDPIMVLTGGEPLARPDIFEIASACSGLFTRVAVASNGTLIDADVARHLVDAGIKRVSISLDGATPQTHDAFRGQPGCYQAAVRGLDALQQVGMSVQVNATVTQHNLHEVPALLEFVQARGVDAFHLFMLVPVGCGAEISDDKRLTPEQFEVTLRWLATQTLELRERIQIKATCAPQYYRILHEMSRTRGTSLPGTDGRAPHGMHSFTRGCLAGSGVCFVSRTGAVQPCGYLPLVVGNVLQTPLGQIWRESEVFAALRDPRQLRGKCGACEYRRLCQGCRARAFAVSGDFLGEEPDCTYVPKR